MKMSRTIENLKDAFAGESQANRHYLAFARKAEEEGWSSFTPEKPLVIVELENVTQEIGLKSP